MSTSHSNDWSDAEREAVRGFIDITGLPDSETSQMIAQGYVQRYGNVEEAVDQYYHKGARPLTEEELAETEDDESEPSQSYDSTSDLASLSNPTSAASNSQNRQPQRKKFGTLGDLSRENAQASKGDDDDQEFFAGGDKSGLAVQEPGTGSRSRDPIERLLNQARRNVPRPGGDDEQTQPSHFSSQGQTLGGEGVPSRVIPAANSNTRQPRPMVRRTLHLWADGFSVDDGPLYRYDDPNNADTLEMINQGRAPINIMNVEHNQAVDVSLETHRGENYVQPKKKFVPFSGSGQRLGSPVPGATAPTAHTQSEATPVSEAHTSNSQSSGVDVNESQPTITLQVRLADGTRLPSRFNTTHTVGDVYSFVNHANPQSQQRGYVLATTFPTKDLTDHDLILGEMAEFKRGGVVVQKWT